MEERTRIVFMPRITAVAVLLAVLFLSAGLSSPAHAGGVIQVDDESYADEVAGSEIPVIVEFSAIWCGACKKSAPTIEEISKELSGKVKVVTVDVDKAKETAKRFKVHSIPAFFYLEGGDVKGQAIGALPKETLLMMLKVPKRHWKKAEAE